MSPFRIFLVVFIALLAIALGLLFRRLLVHRLKKTVMDNWLIQTLGVVIALLPIILAGIAIPFILDNTNLLIVTLWENFKQQIHVPDVTSVIWSFIQGLLILFIGIGIARTTVRLLQRQGHIDINLRTFLERILNILVITITIFWVLSIWQISIAVPVAVISIITVAMAFAIQDIIKDLVAGFYILMERPFHIGDEISTATYTGQVENIEIRATKLRLVSGEQITIPNSMVFGGIVVNNTYYGERRATITLTLKQEEFLREKTPAQILDALKEVDTVMVKPEPSIHISGYNGPSLTLTLRFWIANRQLATVSEVMYTLRTVLPNADLAVVESAGNV
jgi:small-conductance mechanosensitive channel